MAISSTTSTPSGTNIDVAGIVGKLMAVEQKPLTALNAKEGSAQAKISAYGQVKGALSAFQSSLQSLSNANKFQANTATSSDPDVFTATAMNSASIGKHTIDVVSLAQAQRLATQGVKSTNIAIGNGTITFDFGSVSGGQFNANVGKYRTTALTDAVLAKNVIPAIEGATILASETTAFAPSADSSGTIPAGTLTINGIEVDTIKLLDADSPNNRAINIAEAFDDAYVASGGESGTFTTDGAKIVINASSGGKRITFGISGTAKDSAEATKNLSTLMKQTGLSAAQLGTQAYENSSVEVASTTGLSVGDAVSGGGFPNGTTISAIIDSTHFQTSVPNTVASNGDKVALTVSTVSSSRTVAIDPNNNTLEGIRDAINAGKIGVTASIVNDGSASPNRLTLTADEIGSSNNMRISVNGDTALNALMSHDPVGTKKLSEIVPGSDASLVIDGIPVSKPTNTITDAIPGVTLNLLTTGKGKTLEIGRDTAAVKSSIEGFVKGYNDLKKIVSDLTAYNPATKKGATLQGDSAMRSLDSQLDALLNTPLGTPAGSFTTLSQIGISKQVDGSLAIDSGKLNRAIDTKFNDVAGLFASIGKTTDNLVNYKTTNAKTLPGNYGITVTQIATQGGLTGSKNLDMELVTIEAGSSINVTIDNKSASVALTAGTYSGSELATMLQDSINDTAIFATAGKGVNASIDRDGYLKIRSNTFGTASNVDIDSIAGTSVESFMGSLSAANQTAGQDVAGMINGQMATGSGQLLTSTMGDSEGLQVQITGGPLGTRGSVNFTQGYAYKLSEFINRTLGNTGILTGRLNGLSSTVRNISRERDAINSRLSTVEDRYRQQYTKLDASLASMKETSTYLAQQLSKM